MAGEIENRITEFSKLIKSIIVKLSPGIDPTDLDDIEQEIMIKIWKELIKSEKRINNLGSYIWKVSYTTACKMLKDLSKPKIIPLNDTHSNQHLYKRKPADPMGQPDYQLEQKELHEILFRSVESLKKSRREVVKLYFLGMNRNEIADFFGWSKDKVRNLLYRGLDDLKKILVMKGISTEMGKI
jgi:RNA polymerase sigma factor (sigma-70 family)